MSLTDAVLAAMFAALISIGAFIAFPLPGTPIPVVLQNMFILLAALVLGPWWALMSVSFYLLLGIIGFPVFSGGAGGMAKILGPTGGYLFGFLPSVIVTGIIAKKMGFTIWGNILACLIGIAVVYIFGVVRLKYVLSTGWDRAFAAGLFPFIPGDLIKIALAVALAPKIRAGMASLREREQDA
jgi:biotin transport system substrate-specific component